MVIVEKEKKKGNSSKITRNRGNEETNKWNYPRDGSSVEKHKTKTLPCIYIELYTIVLLYMNVAMVSLGKCKQC